MLSDTDFKRIHKLTLNLASKSDILKVEERLSGMEASLHSLNVSVDKFVKIALNLQEEHSVISAQLARHEEWIREVARKAKVSLKF